MKVKKITTTLFRKGAKIAEKEFPVEIIIKKK